MLAQLLLILALKICQRGFGRLAVVNHWLLVNIWGCAWGAEGGGDKASFFKKKLSLVPEKLSNYWLVSNLPFGWGKVFEWVVASQL